MHDKPTKWHVRPAKTQISLDIHPVWSESLLYVWRKLGSLANHLAHSKDSDNIRRMSRLIWVFAGRRRHFVGFVMGWLIKYLSIVNNEKLWAVSLEKVLSGHMWTEHASWRVAAVGRILVLHHSADYIFISFGIIGPIVVSLKMEFCSCIR